MAYSKTPDTFLASFIQVCCYLMCVVWCMSFIEKMTAGGDADDRNLYMGMWTMSQLPQYMNSLFEAFQVMIGLVRKEFVSGTMELDRNKNKGGYDAFEQMLEKLRIVEYIMPIEFRFVWSSVAEGEIEIERWIKTSGDWSITLYLAADGSLALFTKWWFPFPWPCTVRVDWSAKYETFTLEFSMMQRSRVRSCLSSLAKIAYQAHLAYEASREGASADAGVQADATSLREVIYMAPPPKRSQTLPAADSELEPLLSAPRPKSDPTSLREPLLSSRS